MITGIVVFVILIAVMPPAINNGEWGVVGVTVAVCLILLVLGVAGREVDSAYGNFVHYWSTGERPEPRKKTDRGGTVRRGRTVSDRRRAREIEQNRKDFRYSADWDYRNFGRSEVVVCPKCHRRIRTVSMLVTVNGRDMWESTCHDCGIRFSRPDYRRMQEQMMNRAG